MEKPILFSTEMVKAILIGNKTMTRRVVKNMDLIQDVENGIPYFSDEYGDYHKTVSRCPYGQSGGLLWVRETWAASRLFDLMAPRDIPNNADLFYRQENPDNPKVTRWRPSIHMCQWMSRIWLKVTSVRVERLQEINEDEADLEGADWSIAIEGDTFRERFRSLWDKINGKPRKDGKDISWVANPWVWVVEFERTEKPQAAKEEPNDPPK